MKNKGYALSAIVYPLLLVCLFLILSILFNLNNKQNVLNNLKDIIKDSGPTSYDAVLETITYDAIIGTSTYNATPTYKTETYNITCGASGSVTAWNTWTCTRGHNTYNKVSGGYNSWPAPSSCSTVTGTGTRQVISGYTCPNGGTLSGSTCTLTTYSCEGDDILSETTCTKEEYTCPNGGTLNGTICEL